VICRYVCGNTATAAGLTVTLVKEGGSGDYALEAGALVLGDQGEGRYIARSGVTVTQLLGDAREKSGRKYRFRLQYKMYQAFSQIFLRAVLGIGLYMIFMQQVFSDLSDHPWHTN
jgi:hypothetical protein